MNLVIGITGGIGAGKTTVCQLFELLGIPIYYADTRAKELMLEDAVLRTNIIDLLGEAAYTNNTLNRKYIASLVFPNPVLLRQLNALVHPAVARDTVHWQARQTAPYSLKEAALLFESGSHRSLDKSILVYAPQEIRIQRVMERDGTTRAEVMRRINAQLSDYERFGLSDYVVTNDSRHRLIPQVLALHQQFLQLAKS